MDEKEFSSRVDRQVTNIVAGYKQAKQLGSAPELICLPQYRNQEDFGAYKPEEASSNFNEENRFTEAIAERLKKEGLPVKLVTFDREHFKRWLDKRVITSGARAEYMAQVAFEGWSKDQEDSLMSVGDNVRSRINTVEVALKDAGTENAVHAIVDVLKEIANALDEVERRAKRAEK